MTLILTILAVTKIQAFLASYLHNLIPILLCTFPPGSSSHCFPPTPFYSAFWSPCSSSHNVPTPPGLNWNLAFSQGHHFSGSGCLFSHILILSHPLSQGWKGKTIVLWGFPCCSQSITFSTFKHNFSLLMSQLSCSTHSFLFHYQLSSFFFFFFWSLTRRFCHISESSLC